MSAHSSKLSEQDAAIRAEQRRDHYSSTQAYRPLRRPQTVEDQDACALYASVRKDGRATHDVIDLFIRRGLIHTAATARRRSGNGTKFQRARLRLRGIVRLSPLEVDKPSAARTAG